MGYPWGQLIILHRMDSIEYCRVYQILLDDWDEEGIGTFGAKNATSKFKLMFALTFVACKPSH